MVYREASCVAEAQMKRMLRRPFDLQNELPARWLVLRDAKVLRVYLVGHHIVVDGASMSLISKEFLELMADMNTVLPPLADFSQMHMVEVSVTLRSGTVAKAYIRFLYRTPGSGQSRTCRAATSSSHRFEARTMANGRHSTLSSEYLVKITVRSTRGRPSPKRYVLPNAHTTTMHPNRLYLGTRDMEQRLQDILVPSRHFPRWTSGCRQDPPAAWSR